MYYLTKVTTANKYIRKEIVKVKSTNAFLKALVGIHYREPVRKANGRKTMNKKNEREENGRNS